MQRRPTKRYWRAYGGLYGEQIELGSLAPTKKRSLNGGAPKPPTEQDEQFIVVAWLHKMNIPVHHSPNGGYRDVREAAKFKRLGTSAGFPDLFIPRVRKGYHGLYIELKRTIGGKLSDHQMWWRDLLLAEGYAWYEARGAQECIKIVMDYLQC